MSHGNIISNLEIEYLLSPGLPSPSLLLLLLPISHLQLGKLNAVKALYSWQARLDLMSLLIIQVFAKVDCLLNRIL